MGYNIKDVSGNSSPSGSDWIFTGDLDADPGLTVITGDFDTFDFLGNNNGDPNGYTFTPLSTTAFGTLSANTTTGEFTFTIDKSALYASGSDQTVTFSVTGAGDTDLVTINLLICIARGTGVSTPQGIRPVEALIIGDDVMTAGGVVRQIRWVGSRKIGREELRDFPALRPVRIAAGALGAGTPQRDLIVSPQHRILVQGWKAQLFFGADEVLVPAKSLLNDRTITIDHSAEAVEYFHILFDDHEIILTEGAPTESFHLNDTTASALGAAVQTELRHLFPELDVNRPRTAKPVLAVQEGRVLSMQPTEARA